MYETYINRVRGSRNLILTHDPSHLLFYTLCFQLYWAFYWDYHPIISMLLISIDESRAYLCPRSNKVMTP